MIQIFRFIKKIFVTLLCFGGSLPTKCISFNNVTCIARDTVVDLNTN